MYCDFHEWIARISMNNKLLKSSFRRNTVRSVRIDVAIMDISWSQLLKRGVHRSRWCTTPIYVKVLHSWLMKYRGVSVKARAFRIPIPIPRCSCHGCEYNKLKIMRKCPAILCKATQKRLIFSRPLSVPYSLLSGLRSLPARNILANGSFLSQTDENVPLFYTKRHKNAWFSVGRYQFLTASCPGSAHRQTKLSRPLSVPYSLLSGLRSLPARNILANGSFLSQTDETQLSYHCVPSMPIYYTLFF
jgi:hypothetical protein